MLAPAEAANTFGGGLDYGLAHPTASSQKLFFEACVSRSFLSGMSCWTVAWQPYAGSMLWGRTGCLH